MSNNLYLKIGRKIREIRQEKKTTLAAVAEKANVSKSLLSKIENGRTIPSLPVLLGIIRSLDTDLNNFFTDLSDDISYGYIHKKQKDYIPYEKEESEGFSYYSILSENIQNIALQSSILKLAPNAYREKVTTDGYTFIYLIDGVVDYILDKETIQLNTGDSLFFDGKIPHVPQNNSTSSASLLVMYLLTDIKD
ncbi:helix-turn-helix domain-containing protein [Maribellus luteus]|nr:XRE family transcriptional regulator [Maribellus luteus]